MEYKIGDVVPSHFEPGIVAGAYIASICGCLLTVEWLHRRVTGLQNIRSWLDTFACATALGVGGVWAMHFIGNRAIIMDSGDATLQLVYDPRFSILSVFLPIIGLSVAFTVAEYPLHSKTLERAALAATGIFAGLSVVGMHYTGNFGIYNYHLHYRARFFAVSIIIAIGACLAVLTLFYTVREKWINSWEKRGFCAVFLAAGVTSMHFTAATKCIYRLKAFHGPAALHSRNVQVIVAGVICGSAGLGALCFLLITRRRTAVLKRCSQKVMTSCAIFDAAGRILVTTDGVLPSREVADQFYMKPFDDDFDTTHPVFQWIFRVSRNWSAMSDLIPKMRGHLQLHKSDRGMWDTGVDPHEVSEHSPAPDYSIIFRERFCIAAASLASALHVPLENVGVLYDTIVDTGTLKSEQPFWRRRSIANAEENASDVEMAVGVGGFGKGHLLFLTRRVEEADVDKFLNAGFKFATLPRIGPTIADTLQITLPALEMHMASLVRFNDKFWDLHKPGTWLSCFALIPKCGTKGFDVAVRSDYRDQLPDVQLLPYEPLSWQMELLGAIHEATPSHAVKHLKGIRTSGLRTDEQRFSMIVADAIEQLLKQLPAQCMSNARFYGQPVNVHYSRGHQATATTVFSFVAVADLHTSFDAYLNITRTPLSFFNVRHQTYAGSPHHAALARDIHREFGPPLPRPSLNRRWTRDSKATGSSLHTARETPNKVRKEQSTTYTIQSADDASSDHTASFETYDLADYPRSPRSRKSTGLSPFIDRDKKLGGILVDSETLVRSDSKSDCDRSLSLDMGFGLGTTVAISSGNSEETFVDQLLAFARATILKSHDL
ncbi:hypothetical protein BDY17DRAFT_327049 [Neohortaea acidophila]|uniref:MHYT domain-containing protein n=1 Tax=Neohortaea acidophila TaxID=245834 RepID=A0A6A6PJU4_9PEZI|nr:uncharacterized protein BDY17DRAFT_327049 [Neohortaea acidophila]KAF2480066.1 hypothetical protein BDY17DRAFT_327049 [Neohortaea acidophila]